MALTPEVCISIDELVLEGVAPDDPQVRESLEAALAPALARHGLGDAVDPVAGSVADAVAGQEPAR